MSTSMMALAGFAAWTLAFIIVTLGYRGIRVLTGQLKADAWTRGRAVEDPPVVKRLNDAFANCLEMLPIFAAVVLAAAVAGQSAVTDGLAMFFLAARIGQSVSHIISVHHLVIFFVRFPLFLVQVGILVIWLHGLLLG